MANSQGRRLGEIEEDLLGGGNPEEAAGQACPGQAQFVMGQPQPPSRDASRPPSRQSSQQQNRKRGMNYTPCEVDFLLDLVEEHLPLGGQMWEQVLNEHNSAFPQTSRDLASIKKKFQDLHKKKVPTGDPSIPPDVLRAKRIHQKILAQNAAADISEENGGFAGVVSGIQSARAASADEMASSGNETPRLDRAMGGKRKAQSSQSFLEAYLAAQQIAAEREREDRKEERRRRDREDRRFREMFMTTLAAGIGVLSKFAPPNSKEDEGEGNDFARKLLGQSKRQKRCDSESDEESN